MNLIPVKAPLVVKELFPNFIWEINSVEKNIYLTFDDGPTPDITNWVLKILNEYNAKATFFCIGKNIEKYPEIFQHILNQGHAIGNHTYDHLRGWKTKTKDYLKNIDSAQEVITNQIKSSKIGNRQSTMVNLFRPPYGQIKPKQGKRLISMGYKVIMWNVLPFDWDNEVSEETCLNNVISNTKNGSIIVFHDSVKASKNMTYCLPKVLDHFSEKGYKFKSIGI